jgi:hypothetical protein
VPDPDRRLSAVLTKAMRRHHRLLGLVAVSLLLAGGCGGDAGEAAASDQGAAGPDNERFCELDADVEEANRRLGNAETPAEFEAGYTEVMLLLEEGISVAPKEVRADLLTVQAGAEAIVELFEQADWDPLQIDPIAASEVLAEHDAAASAASDRMGAWVDANC